MDKYPLLEKMIDDYFVKEKNSFVVNYEEFSFTIKNLLKANLKDQEIQELYIFLDQNSDNVLGAEEIYFLEEIVLKIEARPEIETICIPKSLEGLEKGVIETLKRLQEFISKSRIKIKDVLI